MYKKTIDAYSITDVKFNLPFKLTKNATQSFKKFVENKIMNNQILNEEIINEFLTDYLEKVTKNAPGLGCYIVMNQGVPDTRENPYKIINNIDSGHRSFIRQYELIDVRNNQILAVGNSKAEAIKIAKQLVSQKREKLGDIEHICRIVTVCPDEKGVAFKFKYSPSLNTTMGNYLVFGNEQ